jgi:hypothetical protein
VHPYPTASSLLVLLLGGFCYAGAADQFVYPVGKPNVRPEASTTSLTQNGYRVTQEFHNATGHTGVDLANGKEGGEVRSIASGTVVKVQPEFEPFKGWGNLVRIRHDVPGIGTVYSQYAHLMDGSISVVEGQGVSAGTHIGDVDCSGNSQGVTVCPSNNRKGPHLHFQIQLMRDRGGCGHVPDDRCPNDTFALYLDPLQFIADHAAALYSNGVNRPAQGGPDMRSQLIADDFTLSSAQTITRIRFWSLDQTPGAYAGSLSWYIYADSSGQPGAPLAAGNTTTVTRTATGAVYPPLGMPEYQNDFPIGTVALGTGRYWLALYNGTIGVPGGNGTFFIWVGTDPNATLQAHWQMPPGTLPWKTSGFVGERAFELYGTTSTQIALQPGPADGKDIWTTSVYSHAPTGGSYPGGGLNDYELVVGGWGDLYYSLIQFNLAGLPANATSARLELFCFYQRGVGTTRMYLDRITQFWDWRTQGTGRDRERLWWADRPPAVQWIPQALPAPTVGQWYSIDITDLYNAWQNGTYPNYGIQLRPVDYPNLWAEFYSSDYMDNPALRPRLVIVR